MLAPFFAAFVLGGVHLANAQDKGWVGENVLHTKPAKDIKFGDRLGDKQIYYTFSGVWPFKVREDKDGWLRIHDGKHEGWVDKADFVLAKEAYDYFNRRIQNNPKDSFALGMRGGYWLEKKEYDKAIDDFTGCIRINPKDSTAFNNRGLAWSNKKEYDKAIADLTEAVTLNPKNSVAFNNRGYAHRGKNENDKAIADFDEALKLEPRYTSSLFGRATCWRLKKDFDKAIHDYDELIKVDPKHVSGHNDRGLCHVAKKEYELGIKDYDQALKLNPKATVTYANRGVAWKLTKHYDKAIHDYEQALKLDPKYARVMANLAWIHATCPEESHRNGKKAVELADKAHSLDKANAEYMDILAAAYAESGNFDQAVHWEQQALEQPAGKNNKNYRSRLELYKNKKAFHEPK
jgi:tetratricopeptide (TPR) repeat protein